MVYIIMVYVLTPIYHFERPRRYMQEWPVNAADARANVWDLVVVDHMVGEALNGSVYAPIAKHFPLVKVRGEKRRVKEV